MKILILIKKIFTIIYNAFQKLSSKSFQSSHNINMGNGNQINGDNNIISKNNKINKIIFNEDKNERNIK